MSDSQNLLPKGNTFMKYIEEMFSRDPLDCPFIEMAQPDGWQEGTSRHITSHRGRVLWEGIRLPLAKKVAHAKKVIRSAMNRNVSWAVSYSGGADSTVVSYLLIEMGYKIPHVHADTRLEYSSARRQVRMWRRYLADRGVKLTIVRSKKLPAEVWDDGLPMFSKEIASKIRQYQKTGNKAHLKHVPEKYRAAIYEITKAGIAISDKCCDELKKKPMREYDKMNGITGHITGQTASESQGRRKAWVQRGALYSSTRNRQWLCHPLVYWTKSDVDRYISDQGIQFTGRANGGRSGCVACGFGCHLVSIPDENTIQQLSTDNPKLWRHMVESTGMADAMEIAEIATTAEEEKQR